MIRPEHQFYIRPDLRKAASTKAESTTAESAIRPKQLVRDISSQQLGNPKNIATKPHHLHYRYNLSTSNKEGETNIQYQTSHPHVHEASQLSDNNRMYHPSVQTNPPFLWINPVHHKRM